MRIRNDHLQITLIASIALAGLALSNSAFVYAQEPEYRYAVFVLDGLGPSIDQPIAVNNLGWVGGYSHYLPTNGFVPFIDDGTKTWNLGTFGGLDGKVYALTDGGKAVGWAHDENREMRAFVWDEANGLQDLGSLGDDGAVAFGTNEQMQIVGVTDLPGDEGYEAAIWENGEITNLGSLDDSKASRAKAINENRIVVGESLTAEMKQRPVMWKDDEMIDLGSLGNGANRGEALDINNLNQVVGDSYDDREDFHPFLWQDGTMYQLTPKTGYARAINDSSQVVGGVFGSGFIWEPGKGVRFLKDLVPPRLKGFFIEGTDISNTGYIAVTGTSPDNETTTAFLFVPVDPELTLSDPVPGLAGETNSWTITSAQPGSKIIFTYSLKGGGTIVPGCDKLDAVLQINNPKIMKTAIADANGEATIQMHVPPAARNTGNILFQAVSVKDCEESQLVVFKFE